MTRYVYDQSQVVGFYESGTYNTKFSTAFWLGGVTDHTITESPGIIITRYVGAGNRNLSQQILGPLTFKNTINFQVQDFRALKFTLGSAVDGGSPSPYAHNYAESTTAMNTLEISGQSLPSFTIEDVQRTQTGSNFGRTFVGGMVDSLQIKVTEGQPVTATLGYVAQSGLFSSGAVSSVTADTSRPYMWNDVRVHVPSGTLINNASDITISVNNNLDARPYITGARNITIPIPTKRDYEVSMTLNADDTNTKVLYDQYFMGGSSFNMLLPFSQSTGSEECFWTFSGCQITKFSDPTKNEGIPQQTLTITAQTSSAVETNSTQYFNAFSGAGF